MVVDRSVQEKVLASIDRDELVGLAVELGNIYGPRGQETQVGERVFDWMASAGLRPRRIGVIPHRPNIVGMVPGTGGGYSLVFNSHMDAAPDHEEVPDQVAAQNRARFNAWVEGDQVFGNAVVNDRGPMAAWLMAARAIKEQGIELKGDIVLQAVVGEITLEPVDEFQGPEYPGKDVGTRHATTHGGMGDFALVAETTGFSPVWSEAGKLFLKLTIFGDRTLYHPYLPPRTTMAESPNAIVRMAKFIEAFEEWASEYQEKHRYESPGGITVPKMSLGAIRGGKPYRITSTVSSCQVYVDGRLAPGQDPMQVRDEVRDLIGKVGLRGTVEIYLYKRGYEAVGAEPLVESIQTAHQQIFQSPPEKPDYEYSSMWRDLNVFNELGIPAVTYGPGEGTGGGNNAVSVDGLYRASQMYALVALDLCTREKPPR